MAPGWPDTATQTLALCPCGSWAFQLHSSMSRHHQQLCKASVLQGGPQAPPALWWGMLSCPAGSRYQGADTGWGWWGQRLPCAGGGVLCGKEAVPGGRAQGHWSVHAGQGCAQQAGCPTWFARLLSTPLWPLVCDHPWGSRPSRVWLVYSESQTRRCLSLAQDPFPSEVHLRNPLAKVPHLPAQ